MQLAVTNTPTGKSILDDNHNHLSEIVELTTHNCSTI